METTIKKLRDREPLKLFDRTEKHFVRIQINKSTPFICWQRFVSKDKNNWIKWNECLSLKEVKQLLTELKTKRNEYN